MLAVLPIFVLQGQGKPNFSFRLGVTGTNASQEGLWLFNSGAVSSQQNFEFGNSTGIVLDVDYHLSQRWRIGIHSTIVQTNFDITFPNVTLLNAPDDQTVQNQLALEVKYVLIKHSVWQPFIGANGGFLLTRDIRLMLNQTQDKITMVNSPIYGVTIGMDYFISNNRWALHAIFRAQSVNYIFDESNFTFRQTLFQQDGWANHSHWQFGVSRIF